MSTSENWAASGWEHRGGYPSPPAPVRPRTYGGWRRPTSMGLYGLGSTGTVALFAGLVVGFVLMTVAGLIVTAVYAVLFAIAVVAVLVRDRHGRAGFTRITARLAHAHAKATGSNLYRSGPLSQVPDGAFRLPGLAAAAEVSEHLDATGREFALLHHPHTEHVVTVIECDPDGAALVDAAQTDAWVAGWGHWLAALGTEPDLVAASVTISNTPDPGDTCHGLLADVDPAAASLAVAVLAELAEAAPVGHSCTRTWITLTFSTTEWVPTTRTGFLGALVRLAQLLTGRHRKTPVRPLAAMATDLAGRLPGLTHTLAATGAGSARPVTAAQLCALVAAAYRPTEPLTTDLAWADVGPAAAQADWDTYRHDGGISVTWAMIAAPRGAVPAHVLAPLLEPVADAGWTRVTLTYRPLDPAAAAKAVEADRRAAGFRLGESTRPSARVLAEHQAAEATAVEEAAGAGLVDFALLVTTTVTDPARLPAARHGVHNAAAVARVVLLPCYGAQDTGFAATLPLGLHLPAHAAGPTAIRNTL